jgi:3-dehydroquinate synthase class II
VKTGSSYLSQSELPLTFGLGAGAKITGLEVAWPGGRTERLSDIAAGSMVTVVEGKGVTRTTRLR